MSQGLRVLVLEITNRTRAVGWRHSHARCLRGVKSSPSGAPNRKDNPEAVDECDQVANQPAVGKQGHLEHGRPSRHPHYDGWADHKRCRHDADRQQRPDPQILQLRVGIVDSQFAEIGGEPGFVYRFSSSRT